MPIVEIEKLDSTSGDAQVKAAMSSCIATEIKAGHPQDQAVAMCRAMIDKKMGKQMMPPEGAVK